MKFLAAMFRWVDWICNAFQTCLIVVALMLLGVAGYAVYGTAHWLLSRPKVIALPSPPATQVAPALAKVEPTPAPRIPPAQIVEQPTTLKPLPPAAVAEVAAAVPEESPPKADPANPPGPDYIWVKPYRKAGGIEVDGYWHYKPAKPGVATKPMPAPRVVTAPTPAPRAAVSASRKDLGRRSLEKDEEWPHLGRWPLAQQVTEPHRANTIGIEMLTLDAYKGDMAMALLDKLFTVKEAAELLHLSDSRIRQICISQSLGTKAGRDRFLTAEEIDEIREAQKPAGRPRNNSDA